MNIGNFNLNEGEEPSGYFSDISRLILLILMLLGAIIGGYYNKVTDQPVRVINRSLKKSFACQFRASLEGATSIRDFVLSNYRSRQLYSPDRGLVTPSGSRITSQSPFFDALSGLKAINHSNLIIEHNREDMYGHATRHYSGSFSLPGDSKSIAHTYEYWIDTRSLLPVRLLLTKEEKNIAVDDKGKPISRVTFLNIRFYDWRKM